MIQVGFSVEYSQDTNLSYHMQFPLFVAIVITIHKFTIHQR